MAERGTRGRVATLLASPKVRLSLFAAVILALFAIFFFGGGPSREDIERLLDGSGAAAPVLFVAIYVIATVLVVPGAVLTAAAGVLFGTLAGTALAVLGASLGAGAAFEISRWLGREQVEEIAGERVGRFDDWIERRGFTAILYLRLIPVVPFNILNYAAGVTAIRRRQYLVATAVGIIPGAFAYAALGGNLDDPTSPAFLGAVALIVVLAVGAPLVNRMLRRRGKGAPAPEEDGSSEEGAASLRSHPREETTP
ncbi:MAG: TVP38/TMEM64 family protein [Nitriliruptorales bacterium]|nr:TVP38/TMEM64 family protein [Nitriliruptorales bacterium]